MGGFSPNLWTARIQYGLESDVIQWLARQATRISYFMLDEQENLGTNAAFDLMANFQSSGTG